MNQQKLEEKVKKLNMSDKNLLIRYHNRFYLYNKNMCCGIYKEFDKAFEAIIMLGVGNNSGSFVYMDYRRI